MHELSGELGGVHELSARAFGARAFGTSFRRLSRLGENFGEDFLYDLTNNLYPQKSGLREYMRWSQLKKLIKNVWDPELDLDIHCTSYRLGEVSIGRYWIKLDGQEIWGVPEDINAVKAAGLPNPVASEVTNLIRRYLDTPREELLNDKFFSDDAWGIVDIMRAADRRIGKAKLKDLLQKPGHEGSKEIIKSRLGRPE